ncbi:MAG: type II toxin-antitoxin system VapC family toxin [Chloroflexi bacterium]|jgi:ribonuclease VapC|nr:type II toxin-antitoxin system VapC family toxin [Chloroflexota bacterium]MBK6711484.1 type II toxin-antitoxin system VapC family toxin [Chloroflexota bacterium]MBK7176656.1 type II toxin-antitoxin system VapC family toxin [Chloroflexota bacterium]MBK7915636.1 type II toxin-antitoxin system VapC family toxin [Chloroflexota bacterium]MBP6802746.1 type II toxin-antitoxin system VapC family toxin [Chloroflexota bacterium]
MENTFILDAWALIALLQQEEPAAGRVHTLLNRAQTDEQIQLLMSLINLGELFYIVSRLQGEDEARQTIADIRQLPLTLLQATEERIFAAAQLKASHRLSYADAFAAAASLEFQGVLLTGDPELIALADHLPVENLRQSTPS